MREMERVRERVRKTGRRAGVGGLTQREECEMGDSKVTVWGKRWRGAGCGGETDGDVLKRGICGNKTGGCGAEELRHSISHLTTLTGSAENTRIHHTLRDHSMWETLKCTRMSALLSAHRLTCGQ